MQYLLPPPIQRLAIQCIFKATEVQNWLQSAINLNPIVDDEAIVYFFQALKDQVANSNDTDHRTSVVELLCIAGRINLFQPIAAGFKVQKDDLFRVRKNAVGRYRNPFELACENGHVGLVRHLVSTYAICRADVIAINNYCHAARLACRSGNLELLSYLHTTFELVYHNVCHVDTSPEGRNLIYLAAESGRLDMVRYLHVNFGFGPKDVNAESYWGSDNAFAVCCENDHLDVCRYFCEHMGVGAPVKHDDERRRFLRYFDCACIRGSLPLAEYLYHQFRISSEDLLTSTAFYWTCFYGRNNVAEFLLFQPQLKVSLIVREAIGRTQDFNDTRDPLLPVVCESGNLRLLKLLCEHGKVTADQIRDRNNKAPSAAIGNGDVEMVDYLCRTFSLTRADALGYGRMGFDKACRLGHKKVLDYLHDMLGLPEQRGEQQLLREREKPAVF